MVLFLHQAIHNLDDLVWLIMVVTHSKNGTYLFPGESAYNV